VFVDDLVDRVANYEEKIKDLRLGYEDQLIMLRSQIGHLTAEVGRTIYNAAFKKLKKNRCVRVKVRLGIAFLNFDFL
jgi:hypothetical protein